MRIKLIAAVALAGLPLAACGFKPLYAESTGVSADLSGVVVQTAGGKTNYLLRQELTDLFASRGSSPEFILDVRTNSTRLGLSRRADGSATRFENRVDVRYTLTEANTGEILTRGLRSGTSSFDVTRDPYTDIVSEEAARERAAIEAAQLIRQDLALYFDSANR